jgi:hypothetical protein
MGVQAALPDGFWDKVRSIADDAVAKFARSGFLRNASITGGAGLTIADGGGFQLKTKNGTVVFFVGGNVPNLTDGSPQPQIQMRRADGSIAFAIYDDDTTTFQQYLAVYDRAGNIIFGDDTNSGQGLARPWVQTPFYLQRYTDWPATISATFEGLYKTELIKQHPRLSVALQVSTDAATTGEVQVLVDGVLLDTVKTIAANTLTTVLVGPAPITGTHMQLVTVQIQARRASGAGMVRVAPLHMLGRQS